MATSRLRVYYGPDTARKAAEANAVSGDVSLPLSKVLPLLVDAVNSDRTWLRDFDDDEVTISSDLYEMILAYQHYRRPSA